MMLNNKFLNKDLYFISGQAPLIILDIKSAEYMAKNGKDTKHTTHISRNMPYLRNGEK